MRHRCSTTVGQSLYQSLKLPFPTQPAHQPFPLLIYGGSTATGTLAIQFAKLQGSQSCTPVDCNLLIREISAQTSESSPRARREISL